MKKTKERQLMLSNPELPLDKYFCHRLVLTEILNAFNDDILFGSQLGLLLLSQDMPVLHLSLHLF
jgi:hypothetical protein